MATIAVADFLQPLSEDAPCGENLEYDAAFAALERIARREPARYSGDDSKPAVEPKWSEVAEDAKALMGRTRDLRVAVHLTHATLNTEGVTGLVAGLQLVDGMLKTFWDFVHPQLDKEDNNDPTQRINSLAGLNDREGMLHSLARTPIVKSTAAGRFSLRDVRLSKGEATAEGEEKTADPALIDAAFLDCELETLTATADAVAEALSTLQSISTFTGERVQVGGPNFERIEKELTEIRAVLAPQLARRGVATEPVAGAGAEAVQTGSAVVGEIRSREDAIRMMDKVSYYFRKNKPSSPVPM